MTLAANSERTRDRRACVALMAVLVLAAALRLVGLRWGLPNDLHAYSYHPDEFLTIGAACSVYFARSFDPRLYNYPSLYIYLSALAIAVAIGYGLACGPDGVYLAARVVTVLMGVGAVAATYWACREMFGKTAGLLAALILAIAPLHVQHSHFQTVDVPCTLFTALALGYSALVLKRGDWRDYILAGVMAGFAAGTKYNAAVVVLSVIAAHFLRAGFNWSSVRSTKLWASLGCVIAAFVISTPGSVLRTSEFLYGLTYEMKHASTGHGLVFAGTGNGFVYTFASSLWYGLGPFLAVVLVLSVLWVLVTRNKIALMILMFALPYYALISVSQVRFARYALPLFPAAGILCAWLICQWYTLLTRYPPVKLVWVAVCALGLMLTLGYTDEINSPFSFADPRDCAARWVFENVPKGSTIGLLDLPWFYSPPLSKEFGFGTVTQREEAISSTPYDIVLLSESKEPDWVIISDYETSDAQRLASNRHISKSDRHQVKRILQDLKLVKHNYRGRAYFWCRTVGKWAWSKNLPHDMRYPFPKIVIYERVK